VPELRVISFDGKQIGVLSKDKALAKARQAGLDLVEIAPLAKPPVAKIIEFGKFKYQEEKKLKAQKKKTKTAELKEVRLSPFIGSGDFTTRLSKVKEFLGERNKVKLVVKFKGRQMNSKKFGYEILRKTLAEVGENINIDMEPKFVGRHLTMVISPLGAQKAKEKSKDKHEESKTKDEKVSNSKVQSNQNG